MELMEYLRPKIVETLEDIKWKTKLVHGPYAFLPGRVSFHNETQEMDNSFAVELSPTEIKKVWSMFNLARTLGLSSTKMDIGRFMGVILAGISTDPNRVTFLFDYMLEEEIEE